MGEMDQCRMEECQMVFKGRHVPRTQRRGPTARSTYLPTHDEARALPLKDREMER